MRRPGTQGSQAIVGAGYGKTTARTYQSSRTNRWNTFLSGTEEGKVQRGWEYLSDLAKRWHALKLQCD